jgi:serine/threonine-protein kinase RsbW
MHVRACCCGLPPVEAERAKRNVLRTSDLFELAAEANPPNARQLRVQFEQWLQTLGAPAPLVDDLVLAVYEALANVVEHAYHPDHPQPVMQLQARLDHDHLLITVTDHGCWRTPSEPGYRGRGLAMMRSLTTEVYLHPTAHGTTVQLRTALHHSSNARVPAELTSPP